VFVADVAKAQRVFDWAPRVDKQSGIRQMIEWVRASL
jgi:CDP-paratose 2-epimerase